MKSLEHTDLTPFEHACMLGNLSGLKIALTNQTPDVARPIYLNGLMLALENQHLPIFRFLIALESYYPIISRYYHQITSHIETYAPFCLIEELDAQISLHEHHVDGDYFHYPIEQIELPLEENELFIEEQLNADEKNCIQELSAYYESVLSGHSIDSLLQDLKDELAKQYQAQPAIFDSMSLPLDWETFKFINRFVDDDVQTKMLETYYKHPIHTAWRLIASSESWRLDSSAPKTFDICRHEAAIFLILAWFAAKDSHFPHADRRLQHFFHTLANMNREMNRLDTQISFDIINDEYLKHENKIDNLKWDMPCHQAHLKKRLLSGIVEHPLTLMLNHEKLYTAALDFILNHWITVIQNLSMEQYLLLKHYLHKRKIEPDTQTPAAFFDLHQLFTIDDDKFQDFSQSMQNQWGFRWTHHPHLQQQARELLLDNICEQHAHAFERTLENMHPDIQSSIQSLSFFTPQACIANTNCEQGLKHY